jgi:hypothetical protein
MMKQTVCPNCGGSLRTESHGWICNKCKGFISLQDGKFYEYVEKPFMPPMTNADRIRAMTDEELAWELMTWRIETEAKHQGVESSYPNTQATILEWLQQPAEGDA